MPQSGSRARIVSTAFALSLLATLPGAALAQETVTFAGLGGPLQEGEVKGLLGEAAKNGIRIREERNGAWTGIKAHLGSGAPGWDIISIGFARCEIASQSDWIQPIDYSIVDRTKLPEFLVRPNYLGVYTFAYAIAYQKSKYKTPPRGWADFWDVQKFPGRRSLQAEGLYSIEAALIADGVAPADVYKVMRTADGIDRAFKKLEQIKPHVAVWWRSAGQATQLLRDGEIDMALFANGRAAALVQDGTDIGFSWEQGFIDIECMMVPKNAPNPKGAMRAINLMLDPMAQARFASMIQYGPAVLDAYKTGLLTPKDTAWMPTAPENIGHLIYADPTWYASSEADATYLRYSKFLQ